MTKDEVKALLKFEPPKNPEAPLDDSRRYDRWPTVCVPKKLFDEYNDYSFRESMVLTSDGKVVRVCTKTPLRDAPKPDFTQVVLEEFIADNGLDPQQTSVNLRSY